MCGIIGAVPACDTTLMEIGLQALAHRGPDGQQLLTDPTGQFSLGHRRLAIIDRSAGGTQPMQRGHLTISCNGELYNYRELRAALVQKGHRFRTESDTEVILAAWEEWGYACLERFVGMWAFGMWDDKEKQLILARDRFGQKPLFYHQRADLLVFASEMKGLFPFLDRVEKSEDFDWMAAHMRDYEATDKCLVAGIRRFPAGQWAAYKAGVLRFSKYWDTLEQIETVPESYPAQVERFAELFEEACRLRMRSDVPLGAALSGGLDSAAILATMSRLGGEKAVPQSFLSSFPGSSFDESALAKTMARSCNSPLTAVPADPLGGLSQLRQTLRQLEELHDTCPIPMTQTYAAMRAKGIFVSLEGHGADELLAGYGQGLFHALGDAKGAEVRDIVAAYNAFYPETPDFAGKKAPPLVQLRYKLGRARTTLPLALRKRLGHYNAYLYQLYHQNVFPTMLRNYDRFSMQHGVEVRMPFADHRLVAYVFSLPWNSKLRTGFTKAILRDALAGQIPDAIRLRRAKTGWSAPLVDWMQGPWREFLQDFVRSKQVLDGKGGAGIYRAVTAFLDGRKVTHFDGMRMWGRLSPFLWEWAVLSPDPQIAK